MRHIIRAMIVIAMSMAAPSLSWGAPPIWATVKGQCTGFGFFKKNVTVTLNTVSYGYWGSALYYNFSPGSQVQGQAGNKTQRFLVTPGPHTLRITSKSLPPWTPSATYSFIAPFCPPWWLPSG